MAPGPELHLRPGACGGTERRAPNSKTLSQFFYEMDKGPGGMRQHVYEDGKFVQKTKMVLGRKKRKGKGGREKRGEGGGRTVFRDHAGSVNVPSTTTSGGETLEWMLDENVNCHGMYLTKT